MTEQIDSDDITSLYKKKLKPTMHLVNGKMGNGKKNNENLGHGKNGQPVKRGTEIWATT